MLSISFGAWNPKREEWPGLAPPAGPKGKSLPGLCPSLRGAAGAPLRPLACAHRTSTSASTSPDLPPFITLGAFTIRSRFPAIPRGSDFSFFSRLQHCAEKLMVSTQVGDLPAVQNSGWEPPHTPGSLPLLGCNSREPPFWCYLVLKGKCSMLRERPAGWPVGAHTAEKTEQCWTTSIPAGTAS